MTEIEFKRVAVRHDQARLRQPRIAIRFSWTLVFTLMLAFPHVLLTGCANHQYGHILASSDKDLVGSHAAGAATWNPLVDEAVARLLGKCPPSIQPVHFSSAHTDVHTIGSAVSSESLASAQPASGPLAIGPANVCFIGVENKSAEELGDFKDQLYQRIDTQVNQTDTFRSISRRLIDAALMETRMRPDQLFLPHNRNTFAAALGRHDTPVDYLLFATITSGTTERNRTSQRDYMLTLELVNLHTGETIKESADLRKGYSKSRAGKWWNWGWFDQADG